MGRIAVARAGFLGKWTSLVSLVTTFQCNELDYDAFVPNQGFESSRQQDNSKSVKVVDLLVKSMEGAIAARTVTFDFERLMESTTLRKCCEFGDAVIKHMNE